MRCPHCHHNLRTHSTVAAPGIVLRICDCNRCRRRYRTEEKIIEEIVLPPRKIPTAEQRKAEREQWHREHETKL
jgi:transcriptional regulator NrdR family protein